MVPATQEGEEGGLFEPRRLRLQLAMIVSLRSRLGEKARSWLKKKKGRKKKKRRKKGKRKGRKEKEKKEGRKERKKQWQRKERKEKRKEKRKADRKVRGKGQEDRRRDGQEGWEGFPHQIQEWLCVGKSIYNCQVLGFANTHRETFIHLCAMLDWSRNELLFSGSTPFLGADLL